MNFNRLSFCQLDTGTYFVTIYEFPEELGRADQQRVTVVVYYHDDVRIRIGLSEAQEWLRNHRHMSLSRFRKIMEPCRVDVSDLEGVCE